MVIVYCYFFLILVSEVIVVLILMDDFDLKKNYLIVELKWVNFEVKRRFCCMSIDEELVMDLNWSVMIN